MMGPTNLQWIGKLRITFPRYRFRHESDYFLEAFRMPVPFLEWLPAPSLVWYQRLEVMLMVAAVLFAVGLFTRATTFAIVNVLPEPVTPSSV